MNIRRFSYWLAVVDEGSFTRAAKVLRIAQPSLSQQVKALEAEIGGALIERLPRGIRLTPAGKAFLPDARAAVLSAERSVRNARAALGAEFGELEVATVRSIAVGALPPSIRAWNQKFPNVTVRLREYNHRDGLVEAVRSGVGDIAIGPHPEDWSGPLTSLGWEEFLIVMPAADPLAEEESIPVELLSDRRWVLFPTEHGLAELVALVCGRAGFRPLEAVRTSQVEAAVRLSAAGIGPALVPGNILPEKLDAAVKSASPPIFRELFAYTRNEWSPSARQYLRIAQDLPWTKPPRDAFIMK